MLRCAVPAVLVSQVLFGCGDDTDELPAFPADYAATYSQVRDCRFSLEHDLVRVRVLVSPDALTAYTGRAAPFPTGAIVLKEEYDEADTACSGAIERFTVMQKLDVGSAPATLDWNWQEVTADRRGLATDDARCAQCHAACGQPPGGYDGTCTQP